jgi:hypothetical protein
MSKEDKIDTGAAMWQTVSDWLIYVVLLFITARFGAGNAARFVRWRSNMNHKDNLNEAPYSKGNRKFMSGGGKNQKGGNPLAAMAAAKAAKYAMKNPNLAAAALGVNSRKKFGSGMAKTDTSDMPYSLIGGNVVSDWIGRTIAYSWATQRSYLNLFFEQAGKFIYGENPNKWIGKDAYLKNIFNVLFLSWVLFWIIFALHIIGGQVFTIWGASVFGGYISKSYGNWDPFDFDFGSSGGTMKLIFHTLFSLIPLLIFFCFLWPGISIVQLITLLGYFWAYWGGKAEDLKTKSEHTKQAVKHFDLLFKYPKIVFHVIMALFVLSAGLNLSGDHLKDPKGAQQTLIPMALLPIGLSLSIEFFTRAAKSKIAHMGKKYANQPT